MLAHGRSIWAAIAFWALFPLAQAFSFTSGPTSQCDDLSLSWTGGTPPFQLLIAPVFGTPRNVSIPLAAFSNGRGSYSFPLPIEQDHKFILTMSDATGFATGGSSDALTSGVSRGGSCDFKDPGVDFLFELNSALQQCRPYVFSGYADAIQPLTIIGTIPGGTSFVLNPPTGSDSFSWTANVASGTSIIFTMLDSRGRKGGSSDIKTVGITDDTTCLNNQSPSSTVAATPTPSNTSRTSKSQTPTSSPSQSPSAAPENKASIAAIAGTVIGALVFLAVTITLGLFFLRKKRDARSHSRRMQSEVDLTYDPSHAPSNYPYASGGAAAATASPLPFLPDGNAYDSNPFLDNPHGQQSSTYQPSVYAPSSHYQPPSQYPSQSQNHLPSQYQLPSHYQQRSVSGASEDPFNPYTMNHGPSSTIIEPFEVRNSDQSSLNDTMTTAQRKAALAGVSSYTPSRFIVHTDVEDELPPPNQDGIVELPPQYSARRGPPSASELPYASESSGSDSGPPRLT
ncbi:hypothetical protein Hypma_015596 [Hypsizygus marmoreus]|uniref:Uncharacterized protein n=1 Tax=Hypsizygus marmoreus TaxID=39966 RepID=A0A369K5W5_HYPMA|nr:hypothetical protein Hypma_015596 [Hypsizygus marmoreus]